MDEHSLKQIGRYQVIDVLGRGALGVVYLALDRTLERQCALKMLRFDDDELRERFTKGIRSVARLSHPNIVTLFEVGDYEGQSFVAMEYIEGQRFSDIIRDRQPFAISLKLDLLIQLCEGLSFAHEAGVIHGDVRPANIMVDRGGLLKILDFGIPRLSESARLESTRVLIGALNYLSPEQVTGKPADRRSDIFAVGALFYELLSYRQAFPGGIESGVLHRIISGRPEALNSLTNNLDNDVIRIVDRCLEKDPGDRYQDLASLRKDLVAIRSRLESTTVVTHDIAHESLPAPRSSVRDREELQRRRAMQLQAHLAQSQQAFERGDFDAAILSCEQALLLDPDDSRANDQLDRARAGFEQRKVEELLSAAARDLHRGALTEARALVDQASVLHPSSMHVRKLRQAVDEALREREQTRQRGDAIREAMHKAQVLIDSGTFAEGAAVADQILAIDPNFAEAAALKARALEALEVKEREEEQRAKEQRVAVETEEASLLLARGDLSGALARVKAALTIDVGDEPARVLLDKIETAIRAHTESSAAEARTAAERRHYAERAAAERREADERAARALELEQPGTQTTAHHKAGTAPTVGVEHAARVGTGIRALGTGVAALPRLLVRGVKTVATTLAREVSKRRSSAKSERLPGPEPPSRSADPILLGVSAPRQANPGTTFTARFVAYVKKREEAVKDQLHQLDAYAVRGNVQAVVGLSPDRGGRWMIGAPVSVRLTGEGFHVHPEMQSFEWNGVENIVSFLVSVSKTASNGTTQLCFEAFIESVPIAFIPLNLVIGSEIPERDPVTITARPLSSAFASYASNDAPTVALLLSALKRWDPQADVFMDCLDLTPNEKWRDELERVIPTKDSFLLFWSTSASKSPWVAWELQHARSTKGLEWIRPMPIEDPETAPPPDFLQHLHFRDKYLMARQAFIQLKQRQPR